MKALFGIDRVLQAHLRAAGRNVPVNWDLEVEVLIQGKGPGPRNVLVIGPKGIPFITSRSKLRFIN